MERRHSERKRVAAVVYLRGAGERFQRCKASDLSAGGVFLEIEPAALYQGRELQLVFVLTLGAVIKLHRLPAVVARIAEHGAGMLLISRLRPHRQVIPVRQRNL